MTNAAEQKFQEIIADNGMEWRNGAARFSAVAHTPEELHAIERAKATVFTQQDTDKMLALVRKHSKEHYDPFALTQTGALEHPADVLHHALVGDEVRGLYIITRAAEDQLLALRKTLAKSGLAVETTTQGDDCVQLMQSATCRYVVKPAAGR